MHRITVVAIGMAACVSAQASHITTTTLGAGRSGGIRTDSSVPLPTGHWTFGAAFENSGFDQLSEQALLAARAEEPEASLHSADSIDALGFDVAYGLTHDITIGAHLPVLSRNGIVEASEDGTELEHLGTSSGMGDVTVYGLWQFYKSAATDTSLGMLGGIKMPTGKDDNVANTGETFEAEFQPSSGSWDPFAGFAWSRGVGQFTLAASTIYTLATEGTQNTDLGDLWTYNAGVGYKLGTSGGATWNAVLELNGGWHAKEEVDGATDPNSGGTWLYLSPGLSVSGKHWAAYASYSHALDAGLYGHQDDLDYRALVGFSYSP